MATPREFEPRIHRTARTGRKAARACPLTDAEKEANQLVSREHTARKHGFADLNRRILTKIRTNATRHRTAASPAHPEER
jgi:hypothetical protein